MRDCLICGTGPAPEISSEDTYFWFDSIPPSSETSVRRRRCLKINPVELWYFFAFLLLAFLGLGTFGGFFSERM
jgi:hypothetical protein